MHLRREGGTAGAGLPWLVAVCGAGLSAGLAAAEAPRGAEVKPLSRTYHVDATHGDDARDGLSPQSPWRTLAKVNAAPLRPGDSVLLKRGESWRGQLIPRSGSEGAPITYGAYGEGEKPLLLGSAPMNSPDDWHHEGGSIWATAKLAFDETGLVGDLARAAWSVHHEGGADVAVTRAAAAYRIECGSGGTRGNHIQVYTTGLSIRDGGYYRFSFRARCTKPFAVPAISLMRSTRPWTSYGGSQQGGLAVGADMGEHSVRFRATTTADDARITLFLGGALPAGSTLLFQPGKLAELRCNQAQPLDVDVGNIIFDQGAATGVKKWRQEDLRQQGDYWVDALTWQVKLFSATNPAERHKSIELALRRHIIDEGGRSHVTFDGLALRYGAAHGIGGGNTHHITVRRCDLSFIGGGHQFTRPDGKPVRFGNAIEFWDSAHDNLVEGCRIWEVYDAALTNQGSSPGNAQANITYRNNVIWNCEYSFEYWNRDQTSRTESIRFEHNTCAGAGRGWGHTQRPDPNGRHLMFYHNSARTRDFCVRDNIFCDATESCLRLCPPDWSAALTMDRNCWHQANGALILWIDRTFSAAQFAEYQRATGMDAGSIAADPKFANPGAGDFRLAADSPARRLPGDGGPAGALP